MRLRLLLDENVPKSCVDRIADGLGCEVQHVLLVGLVSQPDEAIFQYAQEHSLSIVTYDEDFTDRRVFGGRSHSGVIRIRVRPPSADATVRAIVSVAGLDLGDLLGRMVVVDSCRIRITSL